MRQHRELSVHRSRDRNKGTSVHVNQQKEVILKNKVQVLWRTVQIDDSDSDRVGLRSLNSTQLPDIAAIIFETY